MSPAEARAWRAGAGRLRSDGTVWTVDPEDEDMVDAALLAMPDGMGGTLWHPASLQDVYDLPDRTLRLYMSYRAGMASAAGRATPERSGTIGGVKVG